MFGSEDIYTALNVSSITNLLDTWGTGKALFAEPLIPESFTGTEVINFYMATPYNGGIEIEKYEYTINCRSATFKKSAELSLAVFTALNRANGTDSFTVCSVLKTIPPVDNTDTYNTPVTVILKKR